MGFPSCVPRVERPADAGGAAVLVLAAPASRDDLARALVEPHDTLVEAGADAEAGPESGGTAEAVAAALKVAQAWSKVPWAKVPWGRGGFLLSLTTSTAYGVRLAETLSEALVARGVLAADQRSGVELCLHEAVANAIIHGNLNIASAAKDLPDGYTAFSALVSERLADPARALRRLLVQVTWDMEHLEISVTDQGAGFDPDSIPQRRASGRSGRGLMFMRALAARVDIHLGGRCTTLTFRRDGGNQPEREGTL